MKLELKKLLELIPESNILLICFQDGKAITIYSGVACLYKDKDYEVVRIEKAYDNYMICVKGL